MKKKTREATIRFQEETYLKCQKACDKRAFTSMSALINILADRYLDHFMESESNLENPTITQSSIPPRTNSDNELDLLEKEILNE